MKLPHVYQIWIPDNRSSEYYSAYTRNSWKQQGFDLHLFEATTPEHLSDLSDLTFNDLKLGGRIVRPFSETEKAVWYSHYRCWKLCVELDVGIIVCEHDVRPIMPLKNIEWEQHGIIGLSHDHPTRKTLAGGAYYITPKIAQKMIDDIVEAVIAQNSDAYIHSRIARNGAFFKMHCKQIKKYDNYPATIEHS